MLTATHASDQVAQLKRLEVKKPTACNLRKTGHIAQMLSATPAILASMIATLLSIFIFLLHRDALLRKFVELAPALHLKKDIVTATRSAQRELSIYLAIITAINVVFCPLTVLAQWMLGVANPLLWGSIVAISNYAPFIGPTLAVLVLVVVGFSQFDTLLAALSVPGTVLALHVIEGQLAPPVIAGSRLALDPVMVFLSLLLFGWLCGVAGLLLAMPLLTCVRHVAERVPA
ncbi:MAG: AI-2E family transporter [Rhodanobacteraceae bacterium]|nr:AI-2E family transporter [Rhodanobacteraceae bacterium]